MQAMAILFGGAVLPAALLVAGLCDAAARTIPNRLIGVMIAAFAVIAPLAGMGPAQIGWHLAAAAAALVIGFGCFAAGWLGGGDGKLIAATALWLGPAAMPTYLITAALAGGVLSLGIVFYRARPMPAALMTRPWAVDLHGAAGGVPYGVALAAGGLLALGPSPWPALM